MIDIDFTVTREDILRTRVTLAQIAGDSERLHAELNTTALRSFADRADWLIDHRTADEKLAWSRHWEKLCVTDPEPTPKQRPKRVPRAIILEELDWLLGNGATAWEVEAALGRSRATLARLAYRAGRPDLGTRLLPDWIERKAA